MPFFLQSVITSYIVALCAVAQGHLDVATSYSKVPTAFASSKKTDSVSTAHASHVRLDKNQDCTHDSSRIHPKESCKPAALQMWLTGRLLMLPQVGMWMLGSKQCRDVTASTNSILSKTPMKTRTSGAWTCLSMSLLSTHTRADTALTGPMVQQRRKTEEVPERKSSVNLWFNTQYLRDVVASSSI
jgi:hypothetical protein